MRVRRYDEELHAFVSRVVGYAATNGDDWHGPTRKVRQDAVADMAQRRAETVGARPLRGVSK